MTSPVRLFYDGLNVVNTSALTIPSLFYSIPFSSCCHQLMIGMFYCLPIVLFVFIILFRLIHWILEFFPLDWFIMFDHYFIKFQTSASASSSNSLLQLFINLFPSSSIWFLHSGLFFHNNSSSSSSSSDFSSSSSSSNTKLFNVKNTCYCYSLLKFIRCSWGLLS